MRKRNIANDIERMSTEMFEDHYHIIDALFPVASVLHPPQTVEEFFTAERKPRFFLVINPEFGPDFWALVVVRNYTTESGNKVREEEHHILNDGHVSSFFGGIPGEYAKKNKGKVKELTREEALKYLNLYKLALV